MSVINDFGSLKAALSTYMVHQRFAANYDLAIQNFEAAANRRLRVRRMENVTNLTLNIPISGPTGCDVPVDYLTWRAVNWTGRTPSVELDYVHPAYLLSTWIAQDNGDPKIFTIERDTFSPRPVDLTPGAFEFHYYMKIESILNRQELEQADNWLLEDHSDAYLYGVLAELFALGRNADAAQLYKARRDEVFAEIIQLSALTTGATSSKVRTAEYF